MGTVDASRIGALADHAVRDPYHPCGWSIWIPNSSNASAGGGGGGRISRPTSSFASKICALLGSLVPKITVTETHHPFTAAFTSDIDRSSRGCPSHPEKGGCSSARGSVRSGNEREGGSEFLVSSGRSAVTTIPSAGRVRIVCSGSPPGYPFLAPGCRSAGANGTLAAHACGAPGRSAIAGSVLMTFHPGAASKSSTGGTPGVDSFGFGT